MNAKICNQMPNTFSTTNKNIFHFHFRLKIKTREFLDTFQEKNYICMYMNEHRSILYVFYVKKWPKFVLSDLNSKLSPGITKWIVSRFAAKMSFEKVFGNVVILQQIAAQFPIPSNFTCSEKHEGLEAILNLACLNKLTASTFKSHVKLRELARLGAQYYHLKRFEKVFGNAGIVQQIVGHFPIAKRNLCVDKFEGWEAIFNLACLSR